METITGTEEFFDLTYSEEPASYYYLILSIDSLWVSAVWYHSTKNLVTGFARYPFNGSIKALIEQHTYLASEFKEVIVCVQQENYLVYPRLVLNGLNPEIFQITNTFDSSEQSLLAEDLVNLKAATAFTVSSQLLTDIYEHFKHVKVISHVHPRIEQEQNFLRARSEGHSVCAVHVWNDHVDIRMYQNGKLQLANSFFQSGKEDVAYYVLYACEILGLDPDQTLLLTSGELHLGDDTWNLLSKYWKKMQPAKALDHVEISEKLQGYPAHHFDHLTYALLCVS